MLRELTDAEALALQATEDAATRVKHMEVGKSPYFYPKLRQEHRLLTLLAMVSQLEVYRDDSTNTSVGVAPGRAVLDGTEYVYAGGVVELAAYDGDTAYVWLEDDGFGAAEIAHGTDAAGWPAGSHIKLAEVTVSGGDIAWDGIVDRRGDFLFSNADGITLPLPIGSGGTGSTTSGAARAALGLAIGVDVQAFDAFLLSIAALGTAADRMLYTTGVDTAAEAVLTAFARTLLDDADAATARATLGLVIGTNVQAFDAFLLSIAALGTAADRIVYTTGVDTAAEAVLTAFARTLLDDADAATARGTLGLGTVATQAQVAADADDAINEAAAITDNSGGVDPGDDTIAAVTNLDTLTDSTGGTADNTVDDVSTAVTGVDGTGSNAASKADVDARLVSINNNTKELVDQVITQRAANTALLAAVAQLAAKVNTDSAAIGALEAELHDLKAKMRTSGVLAA